MIAVYNILHGKYDIEFLHFRLLPTPEATCLILFKNRYQEIVFLLEEWNNLPQEVVCAETE